jgi:outer membrane lipoprotein-sorting protein
MRRSAFRKRIVLAVVVSLCAVPVVRGQAGDPPKGGMLPKAETLLDNYIKATGGKDAYEKVKTTVMKGTFGIAAAGIKGDIVLQVKNPNLRHLSLDLKALGKVEAGSDGKVAWENSTLTGPKIHDPTKEDDAMLGLDVASDVNWRKDYKTVKTEAEEKYNGKDVYRVKLEPKKGEPEFRYFDKASGLVVRMKKAMKTPLLNLTMDVDVGDYKKVGDLLMPHSVKLNMAGQKIDLQLDSIQLNVDIPDSTFALPEAIKELLKKKEESKDSGK